MEYDGREETHAKLIQHSSIFWLLFPQRMSLFLKIKKKMKKRLVWSRLGGKMEMIKQIGNIAFHFSASIILQCVYSSRVSSCFLVDSNINLINQSVYLLHFMPRCIQCGVPPQRGWCDILSERSPAGLPLLAFIPSPATFLL